MVLTTLRKSHIADSLWGQYIFDMAEVFCAKENYPRKKLVVCVGRQPHSSVWVLGPNVQIDERGRLIHEKDYEYFWLE